MLFAESLPGISYPGTCIDFSTVIFLDIYSSRVESTVVADNPRVGGVRQPRSARYRYYPRVKAAHVDEGRASLQLVWSLSIVTRK
jgi:hypothetical protein